MDNLYEAYLDVYQELDEAMSSYERNRQRAAQRAAARNEARKQGKTGNVPGVGYVSPRPERETWTDEKGQTRHKTGARMPKNEEFDSFDYILDYLVSEGFASTEESAIAIMANMSEDWRAEILDEAVRGSERSIADRITGNDIRGVTRGGKTVYKKPRSQDRAETQVRRDMGKEGHKTPYQHGSGLTKQAKASAERMNAIKNVEVKHDYDSNDVDIETTSSDSKSGYKTVPTDYRARKRRASGR